jgi:hypothetical protein
VGNLRSPHPPNLCHSTGTGWGIVKESILSAAQGELSASSLVKHQTTLAIHNERERLGLSAVFGPDLPNVIKKMKELQKYGQVSELPSYEEARMATIDAFNRYNIFEGVEFTLIHAEDLLDWSYLQINVVGIIVEWNRNQQKTSQ